jgi:hypothetical protein
MMAMFRQSGLSGSSAVPDTVFELYDMAISAGLSITRLKGPCYVWISGDASPPRPRAPSSDGVRAASASCSRVCRVNPPPPSLSLCEPAPCPFHHFL